MDSNDSVESDVSTGEMRAETREILVQDNRPFLYFSLNEVLEEFSYEFIVDAVREMLRAQVLLPEEGFDNHTEWWNFGNAIVTAITSVFTFFVEWGTPSLQPFGRDGLSFSRNLAGHGYHYPHYHDRE